MLDLPSVDVLSVVSGFCVLSFDLVIPFVTIGIGEIVTCLVWLCSVNLGWLFWKEKPAETFPELGLSLLVSVELNENEFELVVIEATFVEPFVVDIDEGAVGLNPLKPLNPEKTLVAGLSSFEGFPENNVLSGLMDEENEENG